MNSNDIPEIGPQSYMRPLKDGDAAAIFNIIDTQREYLGQWLPFVAATRSIDDSQAFVRSVTDAGSTEKVFAIISEGEFAGIVGFKDMDECNRKAEIGYWLSGPFQGRGLMTAAVAMLCRQAFTEMGFNRLQIACAVGNTRSSNVARRLGFTFEGIERAGEFVGGDRYFDIEIYSLLRQEYTER